ncbi:MAG: hypothetical protein LBL15_04745 [Oscillospiraceae bacterium]|jgi:hypothetical protein|nr:hypothetical protein [Oscillospiraceae bacterium]
MAYCYHCGVELLETESACPLCQWQVCGGENEAIPSRRAYPPNMESVPLNNRRRALTGLAVLLIPALCCLAIDLADNGSVNWGPYIWGAEACVFVYLFLPELFSRLRLLLRFVLNAAVTAGYLYVIGLMLNTTNWVLPLGLPLTFLASAALYSFIKTVKTAKVSLLAKLCIFIGAAGLLSAALEAVIGLYETARLALSWSLPVLLPALVIAGILFGIESNRPLKAKLIRILLLDK